MPALPAESAVDCVRPARYTACTVIGQALTPPAALAGGCRPGGTAMQPIQRPQPIVLVPALVFCALLLAGRPLPAVGVGGTCGGIAALQCDRGLACQLPENECDTADLAGTCVVMPEACPQTGPQVCGCDGLTYDNQCRLLEAGMRPVTQGACPSTDEPPACASNRECGQPQLFCELPAGVCDGSSPGGCASRPTDCPQLAAPVCGCDGRTYPNDCARRAAGVALFAEGECEALQP
jgi:hypothetical protein